MGNYGWAVTPTNLQAFLGNFSSSQLNPKSFRISNISAGIFESAAYFCKKFSRGEQKMSIGKLSIDRFSNQNRQFQTPGNELGHQNELKFCSTRNCFIT